MPPLCAALAVGDVAETMRLFNAACDVQERYEGWTPLMKAAEEGHYEIANMLLKKGADIEASNKKSRSVLSFASAPSMKRPFHSQMVRLLVERGAKLFKRDEKGLTPKERVQKENRDDSVELLEELEANLGE